VLKGARSLHGVRVRNKGKWKTAGEENPECFYIRTNPPGNKMTRNGTGHNPLPNKARPKCLIDTPHQYFGCAETSSNQPVGSTQLTTEGRGCKSNLLSLRIEKARKNTGDWTSKIEQAGARHLIASPPSALFAFHGFDAPRHQSLSSLQTPSHGHFMGGDIPKGRGAVPFS